MVRRSPKYGLHKPTGLGYVRLNGRMVYLGAHGTEESLSRYYAALARFHATGEAPAPKRAELDAPAAEITVAGLFAAFNAWATTYYRHPDGRSTGTAEIVASSAKTLLGLYGELPAKLMSPALMKQMREKMIAADASRSYINLTVQRMRQVFRWGVEEELVPADTLHKLQALAPLKAGRSEAREQPDVAPVPLPDVEATLLHLPPMVKAMVQFQLLTAARPGEVCALRLSEIDRSRDVWLWEPESHKTAHHKKLRVIAVGPKAQTAIHEWIDRVPGDGDFVFAPAVGDLVRREIKTLLRVTPVSCGNSAKPIDEHVRLYANRYPVASYRRAITRACDAAKVDRWAPNQLRHTKGTEIRKDFGLEAAQVVLGHSRADVTQVYAEKNKALAVDVARKIG